MSSNGEIWYHTRDVPSHWRASLREIDPIRDGFSYLEFVWHVPSQRWVLYNMVPLESYIASDRALYWQEVNGPDPKFLPEFDTFLSSVQWQLWQTHRRIAEPCWVLQGSYGGHLVRYNSEYRDIAKAAGLPGSPPKPGDLPYAGWDARAAQQIRRMNRLAQLGNDLDAFIRDGTAEGIRRRKREAARQYRQQVVEWLAESQAEAIDHYLRAYQTGELNITHDPDAPDWVREEERARANYIETGSSSGWSDVKTT